MNPGGSPVCIPARYPRGDHRQPIHVVQIRIIDGRERPSQAPAGRRNAASPPAPKVGYSRPGSARARAEGESGLREPAARNFRTPSLGFLQRSCRDNRGRTRVFEDRPETGHRRPGCVSSRPQQNLKQYTRPKTPKAGNNKVEVPASPSAGDWQVIRRGGTPAAPRRRRRAPPACRRQGPPARQRQDPVILRQTQILT